MTDVVVYAGPVLIKKAFQAIPWERPTKVIPISGTGSSTFQALAHSLKGADGRMLPALLRRYVGMERGQIDKLALCAYSAGWGLLDTVFRNDADRADVDAAVLSDAAFGTGLRGMARFAADAMQSQRLMVIANTNNAANPQLGIHYTSGQTVRDILGEASQLSGESLKPGKVREPMPPPSGGVQTRGLLFWYDYVKPGTLKQPYHHNDFTHGEHHDLAVQEWSAYLVPYFAGRLGGFPWAWAAAGALAIAGAGYGVTRLLPAR